MAQAVKRLFPDVQITIGPVIETGFYYDFKHERPFTPEDLERIEAEMRTIVSENLPISREELPRDDAVRLFREMGEHYKAEIIEGIPADEVLSLYRQGEFVDLCRGPHVPSTGRISAFKLTGVAGAYWRGNENNEMLQRIYGTAFPSDKELRQHLALLEEAKRRDHRRLGKEILRDDPGFTNRDAVYFYLAESLARTDKKAEAIPYFERLLTEFERSEHLDDARERLQSLKTQ
jgi:threonyl-tRNA synthetase